MNGLSPRLRILLGAVTTVVFLGIGASVYGGGSTIGGAVLIGLGLFRGLMWVREVRAEWLAPDDDD
ncbi:MAG: hypothetical protein R3F61_12180 [Myxococcota bacterium]